MIGRFFGGIADGEELPISSLPNFFRVSEYPDNLEPLEGDDEPSEGITAVYKIRTTGPYGRYDFVMNPAKSLCSGANWTALLEELNATYFSGTDPPAVEAAALARIAAGSGVWCVDEDGDGSHG